MFTQCWFGVSQRGTFSIKSIEGLIWLRKSLKMAEKTQMRMSMKFHSTQQSSRQRIDDWFRHLQYRIGAFRLYPFLLPNEGDVLIRNEDLTPKQKTCIYSSFFLQT